MKKAFYLLASLLMLASTGFTQLNISLLGTRSYNQDLSDIWGYTGTGGNNFEYAIVGVYNGVSVVDVSDPANPTEIYFVSGPNSIWRDIKTWNNHAYITNESSQGMLIIDLSTLPSTNAPTTANYTGSSYPFTSAHNIYIDENGVAYLFGANYSSGGAIMLDLTVDPMAPVEIGIVDNFYLHDGMARGDTLWGGAINNGYMAVVDVSNKSNPQVLATQNTPHNFTHNCWISDDGQTVYTTDEISGAFLAAYDVSDVNNISELDRIQSNPGSGVIPHNTHFMNNFIITSYYRDGITIHDVTLPGNMIEVGNYDTYPQGSGNNFNGAWGVYPWLPSGNIIVSDIENGLLVLGPTYVRGCYLEGLVTDSLTGLPIPGATITILGPGETANTDITGNYQMGIADSGTYTVVFSAPGYADDTLIVTLVNGVVTVLNAELYSPTAFALSGQVVEAVTGNPVANAQVTIQNGSITYNTTADGSGNFSIPSFVEGTYEVVAGQWNYITSCSSGQSILSTGGSLVIPLDIGIYDDFSFDFGWTVTGNASTGIWVRDEPFGTTYNGDPSNPPADVQSDCLGLAYVTGNNNSANAGNDDVDNGNTVLTSPVFDLGSYSDPYIEYHHWFFNDGGSGTPDDSLKVSISNGASTVLIGAVTDPPGISDWTFTSIRVSDFISPTATMQFIVETFDLGNGHLVEGGLDLFRVEDGCTAAASFTASSNQACIGDIVGFTNTSTGATSFTWLVDNVVVDTTTQITAIFNVPGTHWVTLVAMDSSCTDSAGMSIFISAPDFSSVTITDPACPGDCDAAIATVPTGGIAPYTYSWDTNPVQTGSDATGLCSGLYTVTLGDSYGCSSIDSITITDPASMSASSGSIDATCGNSDGSVFVTASGGASPHSYLWDDPMAQTTNTATGLNAGIYSVTITDDNGCTMLVNNISVANVNGPSALLIAVDVSCNGGIEGEITVSASGGTMPYTYLWDDPSSQATATATGLSAGSYNITVTDAGGCMVVGNELVAEPAALVSLISVSDATCALSDGSASVSVMGGVSPYYFAWDDPNIQTTSSATGLGVGNYQVTITDANGCSQTDVATVSSSGEPLLVINVSGASCYGSSDGVAATSVSNGTPPFTYQWNDANAQTGATATGLSAGNYMLSLIDGAGCSVSETCTIGQPTGLWVSTTATDAVMGSCTGEATASVTGGVVPYTYLWSGGQTGAIAVGLCPGNYSVMVTDANGCAMEGNAVVNEITGMEESFSKNGCRLFPNPNDGKFTLTITNKENSRKQIVLSNMLGQVVYSSAEVMSIGIWEKQLDLSENGTGVYQLRVIGKEQIITIPVIVQ